MNPLDTNNLNDCYPILSFHAGEVFFLPDHESNGIEDDSVGSDWWIVEDPKDDNRLAVIPSHAGFSKVSNANQFYEPVVHVAPSDQNVRPAIIIGPFKDDVSEFMVEGLSGKYVTCVPMTSRDQRGDDQPGVDYHFVSSSIMEAMISKKEFVEIMKFKGHYYGTSFESIRQASKDANQAVLPLHDANNVDKIRKVVLSLKLNGMGPIVIFLSPENKNSLKSELEQEALLDDDEIDIQYNLSLDIEKHLSDVVDEKVPCSTDIAAVAQKVDIAIRNYSTRYYIISLFILNYKFLYENSY